MTKRPSRRRHSLPFADRRPRGLFIDRWGTLLDTPARGWAESASEVQFLPGALDALFRARQAGWEIYLLGNEEAVAQGWIDDSAWHAIQSAVHGGLRAHGIDLRRDYTCVDHPQGQGAHRQESVYLLPNTGPFHHAAHFDGLAIEHSWVIGDSTVELAAGWRAGCHIAGLRSGQGLRDRSFHVDPPVISDNLPEALLSLVEANASLRW